MSIKSYRENVAKKVAGPNLPVCFPAALEQISPHHRYRPHIYSDHQDFLEYYYNSHRRKWREDNIEMLEERVDELVAPLGGLACSDVIFKRVNSPLGFMRVVKRLLEEECRVVVDIKYGGIHVDTSTHAVGILPVGESDYVTLVSTHIPKTLEGIIPLQKVATRIAVTSDRHINGHPINDANIVALPPY